MESLLIAFFPPMAGKHHFFQIMNLYRRQSGVLYSEKDLATDEY